MAASDSEGSVDAIYLVGEKLTIEIFKAKSDDGSYKVRAEDGQLWILSRVPYIVKKTFTPEQRVVIIAPVLSPHLGKQGSILGPIAGKGDGYHVLLDCGNVFAFSTPSLGRAEASSSSTAQGTEASTQSRLDSLERKSVAMETQAGTLHARIDLLENALQEVLSRRRRRR